MAESQHERRRADGLSPGRDSAPAPDGWPVSAVSKDDTLQRLAAFNAQLVAEAQQAADAARYRWLQKWYLRGGMRDEIDPVGHIRQTTPHIMDLAIDAAIEDEQ